MRNVRANYIRLTNLTGLKGREYRRSSTTYSPSAQIVAHHQQNHPLSQTHRTSTTTSINPTILTSSAVVTTTDQQTINEPIATTPAILSTSTSSITKEQPIMSNQPFVSTNQQTPILTNQASISSQQSQSNDQTINWNLISLQSNSNANCSLMEKMAIETLEELEWCLDQLEKIQAHK